MRVVYALFAGLMPLILFAAKTGPAPRRTGAPGDAPLACASGACHTDKFEGGPINFHGGNIRAEFSTGTSYTPGTPVTITVQVADPVNTLFGFQMTARLERDLANGQAGRFVAGAGMGVLCENDVPRSSNGNCPASAPVEFIGHTAPREGSWTFTWTPPAALSGPVHFYVAGNAVNGNNDDDGGDHVYTKEYVLQPLNPCQGKPPVIDAVISAGAFGARRDVSPGSWLEIYGTNLAPSLREWSGADFRGSTAPTALDNVRVAVNGRDAFLRFVSPGQINVQAPDNPGAGSVGVTVTNTAGACEYVSAPASVVQVVAAPGMLATELNGKQFLVALPADGTLRAVRPGEAVVAYGIGFGATNPAVPAGQIAPASPLPRLADPLSVTIGGVQLTPQQIFYSCLAPGFVGLYQFNFAVPNLADGDQPVTFRVGSVTVPQTLFLTFRR